MAWLVPLLVVLAQAGPPAGEWRLESQQTRVKVLSWGLFCGKEPRDSRGLPGGRFTLRNNDSDGFELQGAGRRYTTAGCSMDAAVFKPRVRDRSGDTWRVECEGPPLAGQPQSTEHRFEVGADGALTYVTRGETRKTENMDACRFAYETTQRFVLASEAGPCSAPGAAVKLVLSPATVDAQPGARVCFQVAASDKDGCTVPAGTPSFAVDPAGALEVDGSGCAWAPRELKSTLLVAITARTEGAAGSAVLRVVTPGAAAETMEQTAARTQSEVVRRLVGEVTAGEIVIKAPNEVEDTSAPAPPVEAATPPQRVTPLFLLLGMAVLLLGAGAGLWLRSRKREVLVPMKVLTVPPPAAGKGWKCPQCKFEYASGGNCVHDGTPLVQNEVQGRSTMFIPEIGGMLCPTCGQRYPKRARFCGNDRTPLVPDLGLPPADPKGP